MRKRKLDKLPSTVFEEEAFSLGYNRVAGIDEAGRGPLAGPVVAAACILPPGAVLQGLNDSKKLSAVDRCRLFQEIVSLPDVDYGLGVIESLVIDEVNILQATLLAMLAAVDRLSSPPDFLLVDGSILPSSSLPGKSIVGGDHLSQSIAAASILAKYTRDGLMGLAHQQWSSYGFDRHKGYGTKAHLLALREHGPSPIHRMSFGPLKSLKVREYGTR